MTKTQQLEQLWHQFKDQEDLPELAQYASQLVRGDGPLDASIVFIGEAPGKKEDETGLPFQGTAGRLLNQMLEANGMSRGDVYITNIVKYRPPNNRDPTRAEKAIFLPYLLKELAIIQPSIVVTLGRHSMEYFLPDARIGEMHGKLFRVTVDGVSWQIVPLYHPAAALYNGGLRQTLMDDFSRLQTYTR